MICIRTTDGVFCIIAAPTISAISSTFTISYILSGLGEVIIVVITCVSIIFVSRHVSQIIDIEKDGDKEEDTKEKAENFQTFKLDGRVTFDES